MKMLSTRLYCLGIGGAVKDLQSCCTGEDEHLTPNADIMFSLSSEDASCAGPAATVVLTFEYALPPKCQENFENTALKYDISDSECSKPRTSCGKRHLQSRQATNKGKGMLKVSENDRIGKKAQDHTAEKGV